MKVVSSIEWASPPGGLTDSQLDLKAQSNDNSQSQSNIQSVRVRARQLSEDL